MGQVNAVGTEDFERTVMQSAEPVVVDFWAEWCGPCKALAPVLDKLAEKYDGRLRVVKCNIDEHQEVAMQYGIMSIPNLIFFKDGQVVDQSVGFANENSLSAKIEAVLGA